MKAWQPSAKNRKRMATVNVKPTLGSRRNVSSTVESRWLITKRLTAVQTDCVLGAPYGRGKVDDMYSVEFRRCRPRIVRPGCYSRSSWSYLGTTEYVVTTARETLSSRSK